MKKIITTTILILLFLPLAVNGNVVINEIMYNPEGADGGHEWIEIYNNGEEEIDLDNWRLNEANSDHRLTLVQGGNSIINSDEYILIVDNLETFLENFDYRGKILDSSFSLSNNGEYLALKDSERNVIDELEYSNEWGDEDGFSLELLDSTSDNSLGENWMLSNVEGGTPGMINSICEGEEYIQEIDLREGWNLISSYIVPNNPNIENIFEGLVEENSLLIVKDGNSNFFIPDWNFNNLETWNPQESYLVKVNEPTTLEILGSEFVNPVIEIDEGWNNIAYPLQDPHGMAEITQNILNPLRENLVLLKDPLGRFYSPEFNFNNIPQMEPGLGYQILVNEETTLDFRNL